MKTIHWIELLRGFNSKQEFVYGQFCVLQQFSNRRVLPSKVGPCRGGAEQDGLSDVIGAL